MIAFPFAAITAQQQAKTALLLNCIMPSIGGVLLSGEKGTAKSTMVRSLAQLLPNMQVVTIPLSVTDDMLLGSIDIKKAVTNGTIEFQPGLLAKANGHILYVDEINLLSDSVLNLILDVAASGVCHIEREGISHQFASRFILVGSMNPEEGGLRPQILDRFGFFVELKASINQRERVEIIKNRLQFEANAEIFKLKWQVSEQQLTNKIAIAQNLISRIKPTDDILTLIAQICQQAFIAGHRGDIALLLGAMAHAALNERKMVTRADINAVQALALAHRIRNTKTSEQEQQNDEQQTEHNELQSLQNNNQHADNEKQNDEQQLPLLPDLSNDSEFTSSQHEELFDLDELKLNCDLLTPKTDRQKRLSGSGKRCKTRSGVRRGRYVKVKFLNGKIVDLAFDATIRAAAPFQQMRAQSGMALTIQTSDLREKVRERRIGNTILFLVDASGSMGINRRMGEAKAAVMELLKQSYIKRDIVGLMTFRHGEALLNLPLTRSVQQAGKLLKNIKTGGRTPLAHGLREASLLMLAQMRKNSEILPVIILFSDGRATQATLHNNALAESLAVAQYFALKGIRFIVVDTECGFIKLGMAKKLAQALHAEYFHLDEIKQHSIQSIIHY